MRKSYDPPHKKNPADTSGLPEKTPQLVVAELPPVGRHGGVLLRDFAAKIGLPQEWAQRSKLRRTLHWDLSAAWRAKAVKAGAVEVRG